MTTVTAYDVAWPSRLRSAGVSGARRLGPRVAMRPPGVEARDRAMP
jgi:hypothetical protein